MSELSDHAHPLEDPAIWQRLHQTCLNMLRHRADCREIAEDLTQEALLSAYRAYPGFRSGSQLYTWLHRIAVNKCISFFRTEQRRKSSRIILLREKLAEQNPQFRLEKEHEIFLTRNLVWHCLNRLTSTEQTLLLSWAHGATRRDIAEQTGWPIGTVKSRISRAMKILQANIPQA